MRYRLDIVTDLLHAAVTALIAGHMPEAERALRAVDQSALFALRQEVRARVRQRTADAPKYSLPLSGAKRQGTKLTDVRATFARDHYICRYSHCARPTVRLDVLKMLSAAFPAVLPYHSNWRPVEQHILYWTYSTSLEHYTSFPAGGTSAADNLLTACYLCNDAKNYLPADWLGWNVSAPSAAPWQGLTEYASDLRRAVEGLTSARRDA